jgi:hypothetical protein
MNTMQLAQIRRGAIRWHLIAAINISRPHGINTPALLPIIQSVYQDASEHEIRRELDYLEERNLVKIARDPLDNWAVDLTRYGIDVAEYTVDCEPGLSRPRITQG